MQALICPAKVCRTLQSNLHHHGITVANNSESLATGHHGKSICCAQSVQWVDLSCVNPADRLSEHHGGTRAHLQDLLPQEGLSKPVGWQLLDADSFAPIAQVYPASTRLMGLLSNTEPRAYSGMCAR